MKRAWFIFAAFFLILTAIRLWLAAAEEWTAGEAYLYLVSKHLDLAYYEGPAGVPALMALSELFLGPSSLGLRLASGLFSALATLAILWAGRVLYSPAAGFWAAVTINLLPVFNLAAIRADATLAFLTFWMLLTAATVRAIHSARQWDWVLAGVIGAVGTHFSYDLVWGWIAVPLAAARTQKSRRQFRQPGPYLALIIWLVGVFGLIVWNALHDWITFSGQTLLLLRTFAGASAIEAASQLANALTGLGLAGMAATLIGAGFLAGRHPRARLGLVFAGVPALLMFHRIYRGQPAENFGLAALAVTAILAAHVLRDGELLPRVYRRLAIGAAAATLALALLSSGAQLIRAARTQSDLAWGALADRFERAQTLHHPAGGRPLFFVAGDRDLASGLGFYFLTQRKATGDFPPVYVRESQDLANQFGLWPRYDEIVKGQLPGDPNYTEESGTNPNLGRNALYLGYESPEDLPQAISAGFEKVSALEKIELPTGGALYLYLCENYQMAPL